MADLTKRVATTVGKHFVTLSCVQTPPSPENAKTLVFSGFMIDVKGEWFYVTAGHILRDIQLALAAGSSFDIWRFGDQTAGNRFNGVAVPYDFNTEDWLVLHDHDLGLDYATVHISGLFRMQLEAGGVVAIGNATWSDHTTEYDHWIVVGIPSETVEYDGETIISARVVMSPLERTAEPEMAEGRAQNQFYAKPIEGSDAYFKDADGFSGGPVFALKWLAEKWHYGVIGVQSAWYRSSKTLAICPFSSFGLALEEVVSEALRSEDKSVGTASAG